MGFRTCYAKVWLLAILNILTRKGLIKWQKQNVTLTSSPYSSSLKQVIKSFLIRCPLSLFSKDKQTQRSLTGLAEFSPVYYISLILNPLYSSTTLLFIKTRIKMHRSNSFFGSSFLYIDSYVMQNLY